MLHKRLLKFFSSLRLTVVCLSFALVLVFVGTLAQVEFGLHDTQKRFFQSFLVFWSPGDGAFKIPVLPGGYLLGGVLLINLICAHYARFSLTRKKTGIFMIHAGLILLLLGQLATDLLSVESHMRLTEGQTKNYSESGRKSELAVIDTSSPELNKVVAIPETRLKNNATIRHPEMPFTIRVENYMRNSMVSNLPPATASSQAAAAAPAAVDRGIGQRLSVTELPRTTQMDRRDVPSAVIELVGDDHTSLGTWLVSGWLDQPQSLTYDGRSYQLDMRLMRHYKPYSIQLIDFTHDKYKGTEVPKNFSSRIRIRNPQTNEDREVLIYMNHPLRYQGETYYQGGFDQRDDRVSILQVVRNPSWLTPYFAVTIVGLGLLVQFLSHLFKFVKRRK